ncbi:hypothetical protein [Amygdalobacter nucleatus]|uniref:Uncharacterized protein n=1 Tax=Amygdalobacter nucleatus TaxID=3029274 RepID=A0A133Y6S4_9FIRM|nr:hypothetical protein [Amygdalobacter nucleatus]KXB38899.1 hypothetical protein HMPREF1872_01386 [Amygdalobacter nucleatus]MDF0485258.1 hypothetical protein [Amygdalobacter nucleatus]WEG36872.1 hypothetical protein PYS63_00040 [Amygdalobacter nucleatus]
MTEQYYNNDLAYDDASAQPVRDENSIYNLLSRIELMVQSAKTLPLSTNIVLNRENLLTLIAALQEQLPEAIKQAHYIVQEQDALMKEAKQEAADYMRRAEIKAATMIDENKITQEAELKANEIVTAAQNEANSLHDYAVDYVSKLLTATETNLHDMIEVVRQNKQELSEWSRN